MLSMQPILLVGIVAVAAVAMTTGFLGNDIDLWVQQFGTGSEVILTPVTHAQVDFNIVKTQLESGFFLNVIDACLITLANTVGESHFMGQPLTLASAQSEIQCKLSDSMGKIIAEGNVFMTYFPGGSVISVPIDMGITGLPINVENVHDVHLVVKANTHS